MVSIYFFAMYLAAQAVFFDFIGRTSSFVPDLSALLKFPIGGDTVIHQDNPKRMLLYAGHVES